MKKFSFFLVLGLFFFMTSCQKEELIQPMSDNTAYEAVEDNVVLHPDLIDNVASSRGQREEATDFLNLVVTLGAGYQICVQDGEREIVWSDGKLHTGSAYFHNGTKAYFRMAEANVNGARVLATCGKGKDQLFSGQKALSRSPT